MANMYGQYAKEICEYPGHLARLLNEGKVVSISLFRTSYLFDLELRIPRSH